jgi:N6-L-threonylcarbamoyladenine synthase
MASLTILGIETSCDETASAVYNKERGIISNELFSQIELHKKFGGVVPEIASRSHLEKIGIIVKKALDEAHCSLNEIDVIAVTNRPGLPGSLLVGLCFAKAIAWTKQKKLIGINHLEAHIFSPFLEYNIPFPYLCLTASGGHTSLYVVTDFGKFQLVAQTLDDAAGEAFDKVAKLINLPYPGGPILEKLAQLVNFEDFFSYPRGQHNTTNFSFSGLKTAVLYDLVKRGAYDLQKKQFLKDTDEKLKQHVASSLLVAIGDIFVQKIKNALKKYPSTKAVAFVGGVACNTYLKKRLNDLCTKENRSFFSPSPCFCTDNAAMIAFVGYYKAKNKEFSDLYLDILT